MPVPPIEKLIYQELVSINSEISHLYSSHRTKKERIVQTPDFAKSGIVLNNLKIKVL